MHNGSTPFSLTKFSINACTRVNNTNDMEIGKYFREGAYDCFGVRPKEWITSAIGAAVGLGSTLFGASESAKKNNKARAERERNHITNSAILRRQRDEDMLDTAKGQNMIRQAREYADSNWKKAQGASAVGGGTDAATAMAKEAGNRVVGDTMANISAQNTAKQERAEHGMINENNQYTNAKANDLMQQGANIASTASAMGNAAMQLGAGLESVGVGAKGTSATPATDATLSVPTAAERATMKGFDENGYPIPEKIIK